MENRYNQRHDISLLGVLNMDKQKLQQLITTLDSIEVHGRANLDKLLACIMFLDGEVKALEKAEREETDG